MNVSITPKFSTSKILVQVHLNFGGLANMYGHLRLVRNPGDQTLGHSTDAVTGSNQRKGTFAVNTSNANGEY